MTTVLNMFPNARPTSANSERTTTSEISRISEYGTQKKTGPYLEGNLKLLETLECPADIMCCQFNPTGTHLAVGLCDGTIKVFDANTYHMLYSLSDEATMSSRLPVTQIRFRPAVLGDKPEYTHILIASYASGNIKFWHYTSGKCLSTVNEERQTLAMALNPDSTKLVSAGADPAMNIYDMETKKCVHTLEPSDSRDKMDGHRFRVFAIKYNPNHPNIFISGGWDDTVQYWDDRQIHAIRRLNGPHICGDALDIDPVHNHILTGSWRKHRVLQIWDFAMGVKIKDVPQDTLNSSQLYCAQWLGKDSMVCGGTDHNMARVIDRGTLNTTGQLVDLPQGVYAIDNDHQPVQPKIAICSNRHIFLVKSEKKPPAYSERS